RARLVSPCGYHQDDCTSCSRFKPSVLDAGLGPIIARRDFLVPATVLVLVRDTGCLPGDQLLPRGTLGRFMGSRVRRKSFGVHPVDPVGPSPIMLDDLVRDFGHVVLLTLIVPVDLASHILRERTYPCG